jgi:hypothetical protein
MHIILNGPKTTLISPPPPLLANATNHQDDALYRSTIYFLVLIFLYRSTIYFLVLIFLYRSTIYFLVLIFFYRSTIYFMVLTFLYRSTKYFLVLTFLYRSVTYFPMLRNISHRRTPSSLHFNYYIFVVIITPYHCHTSTHFDLSEALKDRLRR